MTTTDKPNGGPGATCAPALSEPPHLALPPPSNWVMRFAKLLPAGAQVLDLACGCGRHALALARLGHRVLAVDRDAAALDALARAHAAPGSVRTELHDLEGAAWPYAGHSFDAIIVTNYLHRPLLAALAAALRPNGVLIYETFARGNERFGKPSNPDFLLEPGELFAWASASLRVIAYEDCYVERPKPALIQRICAINAKEAPRIASEAAN
jgi:SAM-dependent methyltransferase